MLKVLQWNSVNKRKMSTSGPKMYSPRNNKMCECIFGFRFSGAVEVSVLKNVTLLRWATF